MGNKNSGNLPTFQPVQVRGSLKSQETIARVLFCSRKYFISRYLREYNEYFKTYLYFLKLY